MDLPEVDRGHSTAIVVVLTTNQSLHHSLCYMDGGNPTIFQFQTSTRLNEDPTVSPTHRAVTTSATHVFNTAGTYSIGWCARFEQFTIDPTFITLAGWAMVTD